MFKPKTLFFLSLASLLLPLQVVAAQKKCGDFLSAPGFQKNLSTGLIPVVSREGFKTTVEWSGIQERVFREGLKEGWLAHDLKKLTASVYVNGVEKFKNLPWDQTVLSYNENSYRQMDYYVVYKSGDRIVDISEFYLLESKDGQNVSKDSFGGRYAGELFGFAFNKSLKDRGVSNLLSQRAVKLGYQKIVWILKPKAQKSVRDFIKRAKEGVDVRVDVDVFGKPEKVLLTNRQTHEQRQASPENFFIKVDAAFNGNAFFWDDMLVALATVPYHPWLAASTVRFWLEVQEKNNGVIPREVRKENLLSLWFPETIRIGHEPRPNLSYTNPYLMNWVADELYRFNPSTENLNLLKRVSDSITQYTRWMETHRSVRDQNGRIIGFNGSALGSGADNSRGGIGNRHEALAYRTGFVDFLSQQISMLKDQARWNQIFAETASHADEKAKALQIARRAKKQAENYIHLLNEKYWSADKGFYFDIEPDGKGGWRQNQRYMPITGFWPLYAAAASPKQVQKIVEMQLTPEAFGGDFPLPANARHTITPQMKVDYVPREGFRNDDGYWDKWAHWPSMAMAVIEGFRRSGREEVAHDLAVAFLSKMAESSPRTVEESYGETEVILPSGQKTYVPRPIQHASHRHRPDFAGWGKGPPIYLALTDVVGLNGDESGNLEWRFMDELPVNEKIRVKNLQYAGGTIYELSLKALAGNRYQLTARSEVPVSLSLLLSGENQRVEILGTSTREVFVIQSHSP